MTGIKMNVGELIKKYRLEKGIKQIELAKRCNIAASTIRQYELGLRNPKAERLKQIADALNVPFFYLLGIELELSKEQVLAGFTTEELLNEIKRRKTIEKE